MDFVEGTEVVPKNATLAAVKRDRIAHRLLGNFVFTHVGRSFDGAQYVVDKPTWNVTALAARPTQGVFQANGWRELDVNVGYGALTRQVAASRGAAEWRAFVVAYDDRRDAVVKTDNRPLAIRRADTDRITMTTVGGHVIDTVTTGAGPIDLLLWGAVQTGSWGVQSHRAGAFAIEGGWQPAAPTQLRPWIRGGYNFGSGDNDPSDSRHSTFFQVLPTPRVYARLPFFNMMNMRDAFGELLLRPTPRLTVRIDGHALDLAEPNDLWYSGGGAFQPETFGFTGRPSGGHDGFARLIDGSADVTLSPRATVTGYLGFARGGPVIESIYPAGNTARFGYVELTVRF
jgi:alginate export protein